MRKNKLFNKKIKILRAHYFLELLKIHNIGFSNGLHSKTKSAILGKKEWSNQKVQKTKVA